MANHPSTAHKRRFFVSFIGGLLILLVARMITKDEITILFDYRLWYLNGLSGLLGLFLWLILVLEEVLYIVKPKYMDMINENLPQPETGDRISEAYKVLFDPRLNPEEDDPAIKQQSKVTRGFAVLLLGFAFGAHLMMTIWLCSSVSQIPNWAGLHQNPW